MGGAAALALLALAGCATTDGKTKPGADAASAAPAPTAGETLAASLNAKAAAARDGGYRDPLLRNVSGAQALNQQPGSGLNSSALPGSATAGQASIGGLVLQPTAVNANRSSIFSSGGGPSYPQLPASGTSIEAPMPPAAAGIRNIYSSPPAAPSATAPEPVVLPNGQSSENSSKLDPPQQVANATQGAVDAAGHEKARAISRMLASKGQDGATALKNSDFQLTPGMAASLVQPNGARPKVRNALYGLPSNEPNPGSLLQYASLPSATNSALVGIELQNAEVQVACFKPALKDKLKSLETHFGRPVMVTSGYRDPVHNQLVGGSEESLHTHCDAADIQVPGISKWEIATYLRSLPDRGGVGTYCHTDSVHIDIGTARDWNWGCDRS